MKNINLKKEAIIWLFLLAPFIYVMYIWNTMPEQIPTHWNAKGEVDDYSSKAFGLLMLPVMNVLIYFILFFIPRIDPRYQHYKLFGSSYQNIRLIIHVFFVGVFVFVMHATLTGDSNGFNFFMAGMALFFAFLGNYLRTVRSNWFVGIRTPWTMSNEEVWRKTHMLGGRMMFYGGIILAVACLFLNQVASAITLGVGIAIVTLVPVVYSYFEYRKITRPATATKHDG